jgi:hypothetical protein
MDSDYASNESIWQIFWKEASLDTRLEAGDATLAYDIDLSLPGNRSSQFSFNRVRPLCNMVSGYQRKNRKSTVVVPLEDADQKTADQFTKILLNIYKREGIYETISDAFHQGACVTGLNLLHVYMDYSQDPISGDIKVDNLSYNSFFIDPYFRKTDLSDCSFVWRRSYLSHSVAASLLPQFYEEIMNLPGNPTGMGRDGRFQYMPESTGYTHQNKISYDEYYYRDWRKQKILVDKNTGEVFEITNQNKVDVKAFLAHYPQVIELEQTIPTVRLAIQVQGKIFYDGPQPLAIDTYPFVPVVGYYNPMMPYFYSRMQGICRSLRDPQMLFNRRVILSADLLESVISSGWKIKEDAVVDVNHLYQPGNGRVIVIKKDAQMTDVEPIPPPQIPPSFFQLQETFSKEMNMVSGINEELLGSAIDDKAGILSALRQGAGLTTLQPIFDKLDYSQNLLGELMMRIIQNNYTPGKIKKLLEGEEPEPLFYQKAFGKYHCAVELGYNTETQKQMQFAQILQLREMGVPIPDENILDAALIQNKTDIIENINKAQEQKQQLEQKQFAATYQESQARAELARARSAADQGLAVERASRVAENKALAEERKAAAVKDDFAALLNLVKSYKEMESIDVEQLSKIITLLNILKTEQSRHEINQQVNDNNKQNVVPQNINI